MDNNNEIMEQQESAEEPEIKSAVTSEENNAEAPDTKKKNEKLVTDIMEIVESTLITVFVIVMVFTYILHPVNIMGGSMKPTLNETYVEGERDTDKVFMTTVYFDIKYGDILVIDKMKNYLLDENGEAYEPSPMKASSINECIIKRVIACGGQTIDIHDNQVIVDGKVLDEPYIRNGSVTDDLGAFTDQYPFTVPEGYYFVMGDNRSHSTDSRAPSVGLVKKDQVYGKAIIKYSPLSEFDILTNSVKGDANGK